MTTTVRMLVMLALWAASALAAAQATPATVPRKLGEVLDQGARRLSGKDFESEVMQRNLEGPTPAGGYLEFMYAANGRIGGLAKWPITATRNNFDGTWTIDESGKICTTFEVMSGTNVAPAERRCQHWYWLGDRFYISDSDSDRSARVIWRKVVQ